MDVLYRFIFTLPPALQLGVNVGRHQPCLHGCILNVDRDYRVSIEGPSRDRVFDQARRFFRVHAKGKGALNLVGVMSAPADRGGGRDGYSIIVNSDVTFTATTIEPNISAQPNLQLVG